MNLENLKSSDFPFKHWEFSDCLTLKHLMKFHTPPYLMETERTMVHVQLIIQVKA